MIKSSTIDTLKQTMDIVDVAELYVELKKAGGLFVGFSPFNSEKTPSFKVNPSKDMWHDFSSGIGGDAIKLVQLVESLTFPEAVEKLCDMYHITIEYDNDKQTEKLSSAPLEMYKDWCLQQLQQNDVALKYLRDRGVSDASISEFEIGYSPSSREIVEFVRNSVMTENEAIQLGIIDIGDNGLYGRFIDRIMFPVRNHTGKLCGYSGRTIGNHPAKYVNTKDTPLFHKSSLMYGLDKAKETIAKKNFFVLSEGQMDVVMQHQVGIKYSFASMGTALTSSHVKILSRYAKKGVIAYDGDSAGIKAAFKAAELFIRSMVDVKVVIFDDGEDPADLIAEGRTQEIVQKMKNGVPAIRFCIDRLLIGYDLKNPFDKTNAFNDIKSFSDNMTPLVKAAILKEASQFIGVMTNEKKSEIVRQANFVGTIEMRERELIKGAILSGDKNDIDMISEVEKCFSLKEELEALKKMEFDNSLLTEIFLDENTVPSGNLVKDIILFKIWCMKRFVSRIQASRSISTEDKMIKMREAQIKILELEKTARS
jgi:DNA primase